MTGGPNPGSRIGGCGDGHPGSPTLRLSVGLEGADDPIADLAQALAGLA